MFLSLILSVLLIFCLVAQIATIRKQRKIESIRSDFIQTMIHELKRPIATLKMCVSYMGNKRLMEDMSGRQMIVADSHTALDSLSALFSKLRDSTFSNAAEIPLNLSVFSLRDLLNTCIHKLNMPRSAGVLVSRDEILKSVWGDISYSNSMSLNVQITYLRHILAPDITINITSVKKKGYILCIN